MILAVLDFIGGSQSLALKTLSILYSAVATREIEEERARGSERRQGEETGEQGEYRESIGMNADGSVAFR